MTHGIAAWISKPNICPNCKEEIKKGYIHRPKKKGYCWIVRVQDTRKN